MRLAPLPGQDDDDMEEPLLPGGPGLATAGDGERSVIPAMRNSRHP